MQPGRDSLRGSVRRGSEDVAFLKSVEDCIHIVLVLSAWGHVTKLNCETYKLCEFFNIRSQTNSASAYITILSATSHWNAMKHK